MNDRVQKFVNEAPGLLSKWNSAEKNRVQAAFDIKNLVAECFTEEEIDLLRTAYPEGYMPWYTVGTESFSIGKTYWLLSIFMPEYKP